MDLIGFKIASIFSSPSLDNPILFHSNTSINLKCSDRVTRKIISRKISTTKTIHGEKQISIIIPPKIMTSRITESIQIKKDRKDRT